MYRAGQTIYVIDNIENKNTYKESRDIIKKFIYLADVNDTHVLATYTISGIANAEGYIGYHTRDITFKESRLRLFDKRFVFDNSSKAEIFLTEISNIRKEDPNRLRVKLMASSNLSVAIGDTIYIYKPTNKIWGVDKGSISNNVIIGSFTFKKDEIVINSSDCEMPICLYHQLDTNKSDESGFYYFTSNDKRKQFIVNNTKEN